MSNDKNIIRLASEMEAEALSLEITAASLRKNAAKLRAQLQGGGSVAAPKRGKISEEEILRMKKKLSKTTVNKKPVVAQRA